MMISIFAHKKSIFSCFYPIIYAAFGIALSGFVYYYHFQIPFYIDLLSVAYYIAMMVFSVGIAVSIMSAAYKLIFTKEEKESIEKINIDIDDD